MTDQDRKLVQKPLFDDVDATSVHDIETVTDAAAEKVAFETVDFSDPNRPRTCLEVDFPIMRVNEVAYKEALGPCTKPVYRAGKWWARRRPSVFRQLLISAATKCPTKEQEAAQLSWSLMYRKNHQRHGRFKHLKVVDIFMGGGTTVVEAARLGFDVSGIDLNPIAWWVVRNETRPVAGNKLRSFAEYIESEIRSQILPFFVTNSPRGFDGKWIDKKTGRDSDIDPITLAPGKRKNFDWIGPEVIYTFWMKHIMCADPSCCHLTPQVSKNGVAEKSFKVKTWEDCICGHCGEIFDLEMDNFRMAPNAEFRLAQGEKSFAPLNSDQSVNCPHCEKRLPPTWVSDVVSRKKRASSKQVMHHLVLPKEWLKGITAPSKNAFGGFHGASIEADNFWLAERAIGLKLIEIRGSVPGDLEHSNFGKKKKKNSDEEISAGGLVCGKCGRSQDAFTSIKLTGHTAREFPFAIQGYDPKAKEEGFPYGGRFFDVPNWQAIAASFAEQRCRKDLESFVPKQEIPFGHSTHERNDIVSQGYTHWYKMFNSRQLYVHSLLLKAIHEAPDTVASTDIKSHALGAFQNYLRHNCSFTIWDRQMDLLQPLFANNNYHPKSTWIENSVFSSEARGSFARTIETSIAGCEFWDEPFDYRVRVENEKQVTLKEPSNDGIPKDPIKLYCGSSTNLGHIFDSGTIDLVITDPPFGDNLNYSELADFFLAWLYKPLSALFPNEFQSGESPKRLEAVANPARHPGINSSGVRAADEEYDRLLTLCWLEAYRVLKPGGLMAFTFHHDKDVAWIGVLDSLFKAGFVVECAFPIRSDSTKGDGDFGSKKIEFDIVHVCRKRIGTPPEIYWATLRKRISESVNSKRILLEQHHQAGLGKADLEVMIRGEVLEQFSKHYGAVKKNLAGDLMSVQEILIAAGEIARQILVGDQGERLPDAVSPATAIFFSLFRDGASIEFNQAKLRLKGCGISLEEIEGLGWLTVVREDGQKFAKAVPPEDRWSSLSRKKSLPTDLDQVHFALNCFMGKTSTNEDRPQLDAWVTANFESLFPSVVPLLKYIKNKHFGQKYSLQIDPAIRSIEKGIANAKAGYKGPKGLFD